MQIFLIMLITANGICKDENIYLKQWKSFIPAVYSELKFWYEQRQVILEIYGHVQPLFNTRFTKYLHSYKGIYMKCSYSRHLDRSLNYCQDPGQRIVSKHGTN